MRTADFEPEYPRQAQEDGVGTRLWIALALAFCLHAVLLCLPWSPAKSLGYSSGSLHMVQPARFQLSQQWRPPAFRRTRRRLRPPPHTRRPPTPKTELSSAVSRHKAGPTAFPKTRSYPGALVAGIEVATPEVLHSVRPEYPPVAVRAHLQGTVVLRLLIDERGTIAACEPLQVLPFGLTDVSIAAVRQWRFTPTMVHGKRVKVQMDLTVRFILK